MIALVFALGLPAHASARPASGPHETVNITTSTTKPASAAGFTYAATYRNPANPPADPPALRRLVISLPPGTHIDTSVPAQCNASDFQLRVMGDAACPPGSRVGSGEATADVVGLGKMTFKTTLFNAANQQIELVESGSMFGSYGVVRTYVHGTTLDGPVPTCLAGGNPPSGCPSDQVILLANHLTIVPVVVGAPRHQRSYGSTPPSCPASHTWQAPITFYYADGTVERVVVPVPCTSKRSHFVPASLPRRARCTMPRSLTIHLEHPPHDPLRNVTVRVNGRLVRRVHHRRFLTVRVPRKRFTVVVIARTGSGMTLRARRAYGACPRADASGR
jgi:hypothetical protein